MSVKSKQQASRALKIAAKFIEKLLQKKDEYEKKHPVSSQNENILHADFNAGGVSGTISQDEIDTLLSTGKLTIQ